MLELAVKYLEKGNIEMGIFSRFRRKASEEYDDEEEMQDYEVEGRTVDVEADATLEGNRLSIKMFKPKAMTQLLPLVDHLRAGNTAIVSFDGVDKALCRRMIDFISGAAYTLKIYIKKGSDNTYCIAPNDVDVSGEAFETTTDDEDEFFDI